MLSGAEALISSKILNAEFINTNKITHFSLVSTQLDRLIKSENPFDEYTKVILLGGSNIPKALIQKSLELNLPVYTSYGCSEMASQVCTTSKGAAITERKRSGSPRSTSRAQAIMSSLNPKQPPQIYINIK